MTVTRLSSRALEFLVCFQHIFVSYDYNVPDDDEEIPVWTWQRSARLVGPEISPVVAGNVHSMGPNTPARESAIVGRRTTTQSHRGSARRSQETTYSTACTVSYVEQAIQRRIPTTVEEQ